MKALYPRRLLQCSVLAVLVAVPLLSQNPLRWSPSRVAQGALPEPRVIPLSGDTWSFSIGNFTLVHPVAFAEAVLAAKVLYLPLLAAVLIPLLITLALGRVFCSWLCPLGFLLELNQRTHALLRRLHMARESQGWDIRYLLLGICLLFAVLFAFPLVSVFDPPHALGRELMYLFTHQMVSLSGLLILLGVLLADTFLGKRLWCSRLCPSGGGLSLLGARRALRIRLQKQKCNLCGDCDRACPYDLAPMGLREGRSFDWLKCDNCGLCRDACPVGALTYQWRILRKEAA
jgi:ferredoxin-type protein NapH